MQTSNPFEFSLLLKYRQPTKRNFLAIIGNKLQQRLQIFRRNIAIVMGQSYAILCNPHFGRMLRLLSFGDMHMNRFFHIS